MDHMQTTKKHHGAGYYSDADYSKLDALTDHACQLFKLDKKILRSNCRKREYCDVRSEIYFIARMHLRYTTTLIGSYFNRDHATVLHGLDSRRALISTNPEYQLMASQFNEYVSGLQHGVANYIKNKWPLMAVN